MKNVLLLAVVCCCSAVTCSTLEAQAMRRTGGSFGSINSFARPVLSAGSRRTADVSNGWYPYVIARGNDRVIIRNTPMELRPNRPLHFWGNSRRRMR